MQARYYDPVIGRFYSNDPVDAVSHLSNAEGIMGFNRYSYAVNNPYKYTDPDGKAICGGICVGAVVIGVREGAKACAKNAACRGAVAKGAKYAARKAQQAYSAVSSVLGTVFNESSENTNPYDGPVDEPVVVVDGDGNAIPVGEGEQIAASPNGEYQQVRDSDGNPTGDRLDKGGHKGQKDPKAQGPHAHRPGVTDSDGNPHLPIKPPKGS